MIPRRENRPLTALRGLASVWVVLHHTVPLLFPAAPVLLAQVVGLGHAAVDMFFVLSGFILARLYGDMGLADAPSFWLRRLCRVYPLHLAIMLALAAMALVTTALHINRTGHDWPTFPFVLLLIQPYVPGASSWNAPSWSIGIELACYLLFPAVVRLLRHLPSAALTGLVLVMVVAETVVLSHDAGVIEGDGALLRGLAGFYLGAVLGVLARQARMAKPSAACTLAASGIATGIALASPAVVVLATALLIAGLDAERGPIARLLSAGWIVWLGRVSFSIYLLHAPLLVLLDRLHLPGGPAVEAAAMALLLLPASALTYRFIEQPGRRLPGRLRVRARVAA